jgi:hypothetical protein
MKRGLILLSACLLVVLTMAAGAAPAKRAVPAKQADVCTWGASSVVVEEVNGQLVQSQPETTGCIP